VLLFSFLPCIKINPKIKTKMNQTKPYVKKYENGVLTNPITKENPYLFGKESLKGSLGMRFWSVVRNQFFKGLTIVKQ
jgi:hypothetical protein